MSKHYHFIGIGGIGMGTLASLILAKGCKVSGSDLKENELTAQLKKNGATIAIPVAKLFRNIMSGWPLLWRIEFLAILQ